MSHAQLSDTQLLQYIHTPLAPVQWTSNDERLDTVMGGEEERADGVGGAQWVKSVRKRVGKIL